MSAVDESLETNHPDSYNNKPTRMNFCYNFITYYTFKKVLKLTIHLFVYI